jgi:hypothetical protein
MSARGTEVFKMVRMRTQLIEEGGLDRCPSLTVHLMPVLYVGYIKIGRRLILLLLLWFLIFL